MNRAVVVMLGALVIAAAASSSSQTEAPLIVAYMTSSDGELVPVARFDGTNWRNSWPEPIHNDVPLPVRTVKEIPRAWLGQPVPLTWTVWSQATGKQQRVTVTGVDRDGSCVEAITLATSSKPDPRSDGLAFDRPTRVNAIVELEQGSPEWDLLRRQMAPHLRTAISKADLEQAGGEQAELGAAVLALARADKFGEDNLVVNTVFRDLASPVFFIEAQRQFGQIPADTHYDAISYRGWFRKEGAGAGVLIPIRASVGTFSTGEGELPRYTPIGILRLSVGSIWAMSEWGKESQTIVLFEVSARGVRKLTSADVSGC
jgi:hypothetical protein